MDTALGLLIPAELPVFTPKDCEILPPQPEFHRFLGWKCEGKVRLREVWFPLDHPLGGFFSLFPVFYPWYLSVHIPFAVRAPPFPSQHSSG